MFKIVVDDLIICIFHFGYSERFKKRLSNIRNNLLIISQFLSRNA